MKKTRSELREKIMTILYQINVYRSESMEYSLDSILEENKADEDKFITLIVNGVLKNEKELDKVINKYMNEWTISRLGNIDKAIFRMSVYELMYTKTPHIVSINEGVELSKKYSDEKITKMLNAVLDKILDGEIHE